VKPLTAALIIALSVAIPVTGIAQSSDALDWQGKLEFHAEKAYGPSALLGLAAYAAALQEVNFPAEWK